MPKYEVTMMVRATARRFIDAKNEQDAITKAKKMLLDADGTTPKKNSLLAFAWDFPHCFIYGGETIDEDE